MIEVSQNKIKIILLLLLFFIIIFTIVLTAYVLTPINVQASSHEPRYTDTDCSNFSDCPPRVGDSYYYCDTSINKCYSQLAVTVEGGSEESRSGGGIELGGKTFENPLGKKNTQVQDVIGNVIKTLLGVVGVAALVMFTYGGILWMTAAGNQDRLRMGRETLRWAATGLVIVFTSFAVVNLILSAFQAG